MTEITLPWPPKELSPNARIHWAKLAKIKKAYREACAWQAKAQGASVNWDGHINLWIDFYPPDRRHRDDDNMIAAFKAGRDGLADALGVDDRRFKIRPSVSNEIGDMIKVVITPSQLGD